MLAMTAMASLSRSRRTASRPAATLLGVQRPDLLVDVTGGTGDWHIEVSGLLNATLFQLLNTLIGVAFGMWLLNSPLAIVLYFALPTVWAMLGGLVSWLRDWAQWLDTTITMQPLIGSEITSGQWARLGVSMLVWLVAPMLIGYFRIMRREIS